MHWTKSTPRVPGWYWVTAKGLKAPIIKYIEDGGNSLYSYYAGPIPKPTKKKTISADDLKSIIENLNQKTGKSFKSTSTATKRLIQARINEGFTVDDCHRVIENQCKKWLTDPRMVDYLRPATLFSAKFESYLQNGNSIPKAKPKTNPNFNLNRAYNILKNLGMDKFKSYAAQTNMPPSDIEAVEFKYQREIEGMTPEKLVRNIG